MCGRFTREFTWEEVNGFLSVMGAARNLQPRYNISPTDTIDVVRLNDKGEREMVPMRWGLVPYFHKGTLKEFKYPTFNARVETVASAASFKVAFGKGRRCIIPISGSYAPALRINWAVSREAISSEIIRAVGRYIDATRLLGSPKYCIGLPERVF
jgi:putative SOS response-associated peptidase YedK